jgi:heat shock protein 4|tara:strand:- start:352 stop:2070 length:1719 start_codon:yes stop_codon:yes gene_type:complete
VVSFTKGKLLVKGQAFDTNLGGRNFDYALATLCNERFAAMKGGKDIRSRAKSWIKLMKSCNKTKKDLSAHGVSQAQVNVESLTPDKDLRTVITVDEFDAIAAPLLDRLRAPLEAALRNAGVTMADVSSVEAIGASMRIGCVKQRVAEILGLEGPVPNYGLSTTLNLDECFARGAALQCAIRSPLLAVSPFEVKDAVYHPIRIYWKQGVDGAEESAVVTAEEAKESTIVIFKGGLDTPKMRRVTFKRKSAAAVSVRAVYEDDSGTFPAGHPREIGSATISGIPDDFDPTAVGPDGEPVPCGDIRVNVKVDTNGLFGIANAQFMRPEPELPAPEEPVAAAPAAEAEAAAAPAPAADAAAEGDAPAEGEAAKEGETPMETDDAAKPEADATATPPVVPAVEEPVEAKAAAEEPKPKKARVVRHELQVTQVVSNVARAEIESMLKVEKEMWSKEMLIKATEEARNALETYVYAIRRQVQDDHSSFIEPTLTAGYVAECDDMEEWLYTDEGFDSVKQVYVEKLEGLQKVGEPVRRRKREQERRGEAISTFTSQLSEWKTLARTEEEKYAHITDEVRV